MSSRTSEFKLVRREGAKLAWGILACALGAGAILIDFNFWHPPLQLVEAVAFIAAAFVAAMKGGFERLPTDDQIGED